MNPQLHRKLGELHTFVDHWMKELHQQLGVSEAATSSLGISYEPSVHIPNLPQFQPVELGFYVLRDNPRTGIEVVGIDAANGLVVIDGSWKLDEPATTELISRTLFDRLFEPAPFPTPK
jgi:hypothetical protein